MVEKAYKLCNIACHLIFLIIKIFVIVDVGQIGIITYYLFKFLLVLLIFFSINLLNFVKTRILHYRNKKVGGLFCVFTANYF